MIPPDVASSLRLIVPDQQTATNAQALPVVAAQKIADVLSNLVPGQRILAEIQALLPNGNYRAIVGQRDITLALPFAAKAGDSIELEVSESDGKLTLAFVANRSESPPNKVGQESVATTFSATAKLIGNLMSGIDGEGRRAPAAPLNGNQPLVETMPKTAQELVPLLKQALAQSGVFYEAHQARWVAGQLPTDALRREPQARFSPAPQPLPATVNTDSSEDFLASPPAMNTARAVALNPAPAAQPEQASAPLARNDSTSQPAISPAAVNPMPRELTALVQQQLDGLANQNFVWQGQVWPGQRMDWEIAMNPDESRNLNDEPMARWQTRMKLSLPTLGGIDALLQLRASGDLEITLRADSKNSESRLLASAVQLRSQFEAAGLNLGKLLVHHVQSAE
jgi:hypothetical protein